MKKVWIYRIMVSDGIWKYIISEDEYGNGQAYFTFENSEGEEESFESDCYHIPDFCIDKGLKCETVLHSINLEKAFDK